MADSEGFIIGLSKSERQKKIELRKGYHSRLFLSKKVSNLLEKEGESDKKQE